MQDLVSTMRTETPDPSSIAAHLLDIKDPSTGTPTYTSLGLPRCVVKERTHVTSCPDTVLECHLQCNIGATEIPDYFI